MKAHWTRLEKIARKKSEKPIDKEKLFNDLFLRHHKNACEIITSRTGIPIAAVYSTPFGDNQQHIKAVMKLLRERYQYNPDVESY